MSNPNEAPTTGSRARSIAYALIGVGALLLVLQLGWLDWRLWAGLARYWPLLLVAAGADLLTRGRHRLPLYGGAVALMIVLSLVGGIGGSGARVVEVAQELEGASAADVRISAGVSRFTLTSAAGAELLAEGRLEALANEEIRLSYDRRGDRGQFAAVSRARSGVLGSTGVTADWQLQLTGRVPMALEVDTGVGGATLDLRALQLESLDLDGGVGTLTVTLPQRGAFPASIDGGVGSMVVRIPRTLEARVRVDSGLGAVRVPDRFARSGDVYTSPGFDSASDRVELRINAGVGSVRLESVD